MGLPVSRRRQFKMKSALALGMTNAVNAQQTSALVAAFRIEGSLSGLTDQIVLGFRSRI
jgi:hypothetical protein